VRQIVHRLRDKGAAGFNVTVPHKLAVMEHLDQRDATATKIGAVNTVTRVGDTLVGSNTDAYGFIMNLREGLGDLTPYLKNIVILGAGGATRAAIVALKDAGAQTITLTNRSAEKAQTLADEFGVAALPWSVRNNLLAEATLLINTTSLGMEGQPELSIDVSLLPESAAVHDIVYAPLETELLKNARARGLKTVDGLGMLLYQAQKAFELWHGVLPEVTPELRTIILK
jgi:shikimate dehydrogenase